ncbi:MAG: sugar ABC transporter substrate-binding protein [Clostridiales bacterium]|nr:sugar ABC transporter substrate-binding protein [Clostridiales bacterium]
MKTKKLLALVFSMLLVVAVFAGCGDSGGGGEAPPPDTGGDAPVETPAEPPADTGGGLTSVTAGDYTFELDLAKNPADIEIAVVYMNTTVPFAQAIKMGVDAAAEEFGINAYMTGKESWDTAVEIDVVQNLIMKGVDAIGVAVMDEPGMTPIIQESLENNIPLATYNVDAPASGRLGFVGENLFDAGAATARDVAEAMGGEGKVLISSVAQSSTWSRQRQDGVESVLAEYPDIEIVQVVDSPGSEQETYGILENALLAHPDIDGHISLGGTGYVWARVLIENNMGNIDSDHPIYSSGHDLTPAKETLDQIKDGWLLSMYTQNPYNQGYLVTKMLYSFLTTGDAGSFSVVDSEITGVNRSNMDKFYQDLDDGLPVG